MRMKRLLILFCAVAILGLPPAEAAKGRSSSTTRSSSGSGKVRVRSYTRKDGTRVQAHERSRPSATPKARSTSPNSPKTPSSTRDRGTFYCASCERDSNGRIARNSSARAAFQASHPCPSTSKTSGACPGYVVDHVVPLKRGGPDQPSNMQWQTEADAKAKDRVED